jgi:ATP-dependent Lon protease
VVVNNAGIVRRGKFVHETAIEDWDQVIAVNLRGPFLVSRAFLPSMLARGSGRFIHVASISSTIGSPGAASYAASKWGLVGFSKSLAEELRGTGLTSVAILPGSVDTDMLKGSGFTPQMSASDVADMIVHAALDAPAALTGSAIEMFGDSPASGGLRDLAPALSALPLFPLPTVLFPGALMPLHIFEPRYRVMVRDALDTHRALAVVLITDPDQLDEHGHPRIAEIAGAGVIVDHVELPSGRFNILVRGRARVRLTELPFGDKPYRRARAEVLAPGGEAEAINVAALIAAATAFAARVRERDPNFELALPKDAPAGVVADLCAHHLVLDARERQAALAALDVGERVRRVAEVLALQRLALSHDPKEMN